MMKHKAILHVAMVAIGLLMTTASVSQATLPTEVKGHERCIVCGMMVAKYPEWIAQIALADGKVLMFDGVKDMLVFYFFPEEYGGGGEIVEMAVKEYYSQEWLDASGAFYVVGSDVYGPMGEEFIPCATREAAESFLRDHHGEQILPLEEITPELVQSMRKGHKMKKKMSDK